MKIEYYCPRWGSEELTVEDFLRKAKKSGYDGVEISNFKDGNSEADILMLLNRYGLKLIAQQYLLPQKETVADYIVRFSRRLYELAAYKPLFINSHTGRDYYSFEDNCMIFELANKISAETGVPIVHETHRGRALFSATAAKQFFTRFPELKIAADFSHWCVVSESLLEDQEELVIEAINHSGHIHTRVGHAQGPQVSHPNAPEHQQALEQHVKWWKAIIDKKRAENIDVFTLTTEFGPWPYMPALPFTNQPVANQWEVNTFMMSYLKKKLE